MALKKIQIAVVDLVASASAAPRIHHVDFMSLSAHNPTVVKGKIESLTAKIERIKAKPKTEARTRRMAEVKKRVGELKVLLKEAIKAEKDKPKGDAKLAKKGRKAEQTAEKPAGKKVGEHTQKVLDRKAAMRERIKKLRALPKSDANTKKINGLNFDLKRMGHAMTTAAKKDRAASQKAKAAGNPDALIKKIQRLREALVLNRAERIGDRWGKKRDQLNRKAHNLQLDLKEALKAAKAAKVKVPKDDTVRKPIKQKPDRHDEW